MVWPRPITQARAALLLGAFDPPTNAHIAVLTAAARSVCAQGVLCLTKVVLARSVEPLLDVADRISVLLDIADRCEFGVAFSNRGTYVDVGRALMASGIDAAFAIGADKLEQLADASFYPDGERGVAATFRDLRFVVTPRRGFEEDAPGRGCNVSILDRSQVFADVATAGITATEVRRLHREGRAVDHLVPPEVVHALRGYTSPR